MCSINHFFILYFAIFSLGSMAQTPENGILQGRVYNAKNNEPVPYATISIGESTKSSQSDTEGNFLFTDLKPGYTVVKATSVGFKTYMSAPFLITNAKKTNIDIPLEENQITLQEVTVQSSPFRRKEESPVSLRRIGTAEMERIPGSNRDISRVIQAFPGVSSTPAYRNDIIVRGGGASENRFYLDGIEIPNLNHFSTQGASGGPVGMINIDFVKEINFYSGAFPASRGNAMSSVLEINQLDGNKEKTRFKGSLGASDLALTLDGPAGKKTTYMASVRRSYLQFLFAGLGLPFLPTYNDCQFKIRTRINEKNEIIVVGLGAIDQFKLNLKANKTEYQRYILEYLPVFEQWNYAAGFVYKHYSQNGYDTWVVSRNHLNNAQYKYRGNIETDSLKILDYDSYESENKFRYERNARTSSGYKINLGLNLEQSNYYNRTFRQTFTGIPINYRSTLEFYKWGLFGQVSKSYASDRLSFSLGVRSDANSYSNEMNRLTRQLSPRFSVSYALSPRLSVSANTGRYYQLPPYTSLGLRNQTGDLVNKQNHIDYICADHLVTGIEYLPDATSKFSIEGFYKWYHKYPFSIADSISIASKGADYGTFGDEAVVSTSKGRAYGLEIFYQNLGLKGFNFILSYTLVRSEAENVRSGFIPTSWDNKHLLNITCMRSLKRNWDIGFKWRFVGGAPYTPWNIDKSSLATAWNAQGRAYPDYSRFNQSRLKAFHQLDIRIDKEYFYKKWSLRFYADIQNAYGFKSDEQDPLVRETGTDGAYLPATGDLARYPLKTLKSEGGGTVLPTVGLIVEL
jgi:hypothetical protein